MHDYVGETQAQYEDVRLDALNGILALLPEEFRANTINQRLLTQIARATPGKLSSPFEQIRSGDIIPVLSRLFHIEWKCEWGAYLELIAPPGHRCAYLENEDTETVFKLLMFFDAFLLKHNVIKPCGGQYLMRPRQLWTLASGDGSGDQ